MISDEGHKEEASDPPLLANNIEQKTENSDLLTFGRLSGKLKLIRSGNEVDLEKNIIQMKRTNRYHKL